MKNPLEGSSGWALVMAWSASSSLRGFEAFSIPANQRYAAQPHSRVVNTGSSRGIRSSNVISGRSETNVLSGSFSTVELTSTSYRRLGAQRWASQLSYCTEGRGVRGFREHTTADDGARRSRKAPWPDRTRPRIFGHRPDRNMQQRCLCNFLPPLFSSDQDWLEALKEMSGDSGLPMGPKKKMAGLEGMTTKDSRVAQNNALKEWMGENGVWVFDRSDWGVAPHALSVAVDTVDENENEMAGRGMMSNREIKEGDELFSMPIDLLLTKEAAKKEFGTDVITEDLSEYIAIALLLVAERAKGDSSFWKSYIEVLPSVEEVYPTYLWTEEDLRLLEGSPVIAATESIRRKLEAEYETVEKDLLDKFPQLLPKEVQTFEAFQWAFAMLFSRAIRLGGLSTGEAVALVPYADLFNHNPFASSYIDARQTGLFSKQDEVAVFADRSYKKMEQVYISYGPKSNADLLLLYGFSLDRNPYNSVEVNISLDEDDELFEEKKTFLEEAGLPCTKAFPLYNDRYPDELLQYLRLIQLNRDQLRDKTLEDLMFEKKQTDVNELMVLDSLVEACKTTLEGYPTTEEEDSVLMNDPSMFRAFSKAQRMAVKHRRQEKRILRRTIAAVSREKEKLGLPLGGRIS